MSRAAGIALLLLAAASCSRPLAPDASGEEIYAARCASCHGADLRGGGLLNPNAPSLGPGSEAAARSDAFYVQTITRGQGRMPAVRGLTPEQVERVIGYVRSVQEGG